VSTYDEVSVSMEKSGLRERWCLSSSLGVLKHRGVWSYIGAGFACSLYKKKKMNKKVGK